MKQPLLITKSKVEEYLQIAIGFNTNGFERFIREAQEFDLKPLVCEDFYYKMLKNKEADPYDKIITGQEYTFEEKTYYHEGLEAVLSYFAYARFILKSDVVSTTHGIVKKTTPNSEAVSHTEKKDIYYTSKQDANALFEAVTKYMDRKDINYKDCNDCNDTPTGSDIVTRALQW